MTKWLYNEQGCTISIVSRGVTTLLSVEGDGITIYPLEVVSRVGEHFHLFIQPYEMYGIGKFTFYIENHITPNSAPRD